MVPKPLLFDAPELVENPVFCSVLLVVPNPIVLVLVLVLVLVVVLALVLVVAEVVVALNPPNEKDGAVVAAVEVVVFELAAAPKQLLY